MKDRKNDVIQDDFCFLMVVDIVEIVVIIFSIIIISIGTTHGIFVCILLTIVGNNFSKVLYVDNFNILNIRSHLVRIC